MLAVVLLMVPSLASADCNEIHYRITGRVGGDNDDSLAGALVTAQWEENGRPADAVNIVTDTDGRFELPIDFYTWTGRRPDGTDRCESVLDRVRLSVEAKGHEPRELAVEMDALEKHVDLQLTGASE